MISKELRNRYLDKSGDEFICITNLIENEHGFASYFMESGVLVVICLCGDGKYWNEFFENLARKNNCNKIRFTTKRNPEAWKKLLGVDLVGYILERDIQNE